MDSNEDNSLAPDLNNFASDNIAATNDNIELDTDPDTLITLPSCLAISGVVVFDANK